MLVERSASWTAWRVLLIAGFALIAALNLPGHAPLDSLSGLWEGRNNLRMSWGPRMYSAILGFFDRLAPGFGLYTMASLMLTALSWAALPLLSRRVGWTAPLALACAFTLPQLLIYQGIVWRDVLFANLMLGAFVALALAAQLWTRPRLRWPLLAAGALALSLGALVRQNGGVAMVPWAIALGWIAARGRWRDGLGWGAAGLAAVLLAMLALNHVNPVQEQRTGRRDIGPRLLAHYDLTAALAEDPDRPLPRLQQDRPLSLEVLRRDARRVYSPTRIDTLDWNRWYGRAMWRFETPAMMGAWRDMIVSDPVGYARRRLEIFRWVLLTPRLDLCVPLHLGVKGLPHLETELGIAYGDYPQDGRLYAYAKRWFPTPFYSHLTWGLVAAAAGVFLLVRRTPSDVAMAGLMVSALVFAATFFLLSIACDYRYLYAVDLAGITGALYVALDPKLRRRPAAD